MNEEKCRLRKTQGGKITFRISLEYNFIFQKDSVFKQEDQADIFKNLW